jgi:uncharacterized MnhB-related membrane protein
VSAILHALLFCLLFWFALVAVAFGNYVEAVLLFVATSFYAGLNYCIHLADEYGGDDDS